LGESSGASGESTDWYSPILSQKNVKKTSLLVRSSTEVDLFSKEYNLTNPTKTLHIARVAIHLLNGGLWRFVLNPCIFWARMEDTEESDIGDGIFHSLCRWLLDVMYLYWIELAKETTMWGPQET
jgi:hypothetical protein